MKLNLSERFAVMGILPKETNFTNLKVIRDLQDALSPDEKETKNLEIKTIQAGQNIRTTWDIKKGEKEVEIKVGEMATNIIKEELEKLNKGSKLTQEHLSIYEKFVDKVK